MVILKDELLPAYKKIYLDKDISFETFLKYILPLYELSSKKKNKPTAASSEESSDSENQHDTGSDSDQLQVQFESESNSCMQL